MRVVQANLQHSRAASAALHRLLATKTVDLALIQEPWVSFGKIAGLCPAGFGIIYDNKESRPRTCIVYNKNINCFPSTDLCTRDLAAAKMEVRMGNRRCWILICSAYFPYDSITPPPTRELRDLINSAEDNSSHVIIACDANAHHSTWGSSGTNRRGEYLFDYLLTTNLVVVNRGTEPTFDNGRRKEVIDLTLASRFISEMINDWKVSDEPSCSDHRHILFKIGEGVNVS